MGPLDKGIRCSVASVKFVAPGSLPVAAAHTDGAFAPLRMAASIEFTTLSSSHILLVMFKLLVIFGCKCSHIVTAHGSLYELLVLEC